MDMFSYLIVQLAIVVAISAVGISGDVRNDSLPIQVESEERRLINDLLARYQRLGKVARPVTNASEAVAVEFGIRLVHLDLDEKEQLMKTSCWVRMKWYDRYLEWNPANYGGVTHITIPASMIWTPDISLVNSGEAESGGYLADLSIKFIGRVFWAPQRKYSSACLIDVTEYPYDRHTCDMWFQSISNYDWSLNLSAYYKSPLDLDTYLTSYKDAQEWDIVSNTSLRLDRPRDVGMILMYSRRASLRFALTVQRRPGFKALLLIIPCTLMSFLFPLIFCFPPERPDRHTLAMSLFASLTIMLFMVNETAPPSAAFVPRLTLYYSFTLLVLLIATSCSAIVVNLSKRGETRDRVPKWVRQVFIRGFGRILCFGNRIEHLTNVKRVSRNIRLRKSQKQRNPEGTTPVSENGVVTENTGAVPEAFPAQNTTGELQREASIEHPVLVVMNRKLSLIESKLKKPESDEEMPDITAPVDMRLEWRILSLVLDRLFCIVFLIISIISFAVFHPRYVE